MQLAERLTADERLRGMAFNFSNELQITVLELVKKILERMQSALRAGDTESAAERNSPPIPERRAGANRLGLGSPLHA